MLHITGTGSKLLLAAVLLLAGSQIGPRAHGDEPTAANPREAFVTFLRSPIGVGTTIGAAAAIGVGAFGATLYALRSQTASAPTTRSRRRRRTHAEQADSGFLSKGAIGRAIAATLCAGCLLLTLTFSIALEDVFAEPKTMILRLIAALVGVLLAVATVRRIPIARMAVVDVALLIFLGLTFVATIASVDPSLSLHGVRYQYQGLFAFIAYSVLFLGARFALTDVARVRLLATALVIAAGLAAAYAVIQWLRVDPIWSGLYKGRVFSTVGQANALGATLAMALLAALALVPGRSRTTRPVLLAVVALIAFGLLLTLSRGGYLGLVIGGAVAVAILVVGRPLASLRKMLPRAAVLGVSIISLLLAAGLVWRPAGRVMGQVVSRALTIADASESSNLSHIDLWTVGVRIAADHPLIGTGPDTYPILFARYRDTVLPPNRAAVMARFTPESPHNVYLAVADGAGLPALAAYLNVVLGTMAAVARTARRTLELPARLALAGLTGAAVVHLVTDSFMTGEPGSTAILWMILGSLAGFSASLARQTQPK